MPLNQEQMELIKQIESIFFPYAYKRRERLLEKNLGLVHYTTAETAIKIIKNQTFWMRDTRCMSDFREVQHGFELLLRYFNKDDGKNRAKFCTAVDGSFADAGKEALKRFDDWWAHIQSGTYICCFSEHDPKTDNDYGRLSMWRAYGQKSGVAIVLKPPPPAGALPLNVLLSPVAYFADKHLDREFDDVIYKIGHHSQFLKTQPRANVIFFAYRMLAMAAVSLKHPAFKEEQEWRLVHFPAEQPSPHVEHTTEIVGGISQLVYKVRMRNEPSADINGISFPELFDRIIIGPTQYAGPIYASLVEELGNAGVTDSAKKVFFSGVPLRT